MDLIFDGNSRVTQIPLRLIWCLGLHPGSKSISANIVAVIHLCIPLSILIMAIIQIIHVAHTDINNVVECFQTVLLVTQSFLQGCCILFKRQKLAEILETSTGALWKLHMFEEHERVPFKRLLDRIRLFNTSFLIMSSVCCAIFIVVAILNQIAPLMSYVPEGWLPFFFPYHCYCIWVNNNNVISFDAIFGTICLEIVLQFKMVQHRLKTLESNVANRKFEQFYDGFRKCVVHHNFLLDFCRAFNKVYSEVFVIQFLFVTWEICVGLYISTQKDVHTQTKLTSAWLSGSFAIQFAVYCVCGQLLSESTSSVRDSLYQSDWYEVDSCRYKKDMILPLLRSGYEFVLIGSGLVKINLAALTVVFKTAMSFYAFLQTITGKKESTS